MDKEAIENLLLDYTRQKQINEEHQKINGELREKVKELENFLSKMYDNDNLINKLNEGSTFTSNQMKFIYKNFIKKQKIKDKIEELKNKLKFIACSKDCNKCFDKKGNAIYRGSGFIPCYAYHQIKVLQELLKESEDK